MTKQWSNFSSRYSLISSIVIMLLSAAALFGWAHGSYEFPRYVFGYPLMVPNTALGFLLGAFSVILLWKKPVSGLRFNLSCLNASILILISITALIEFGTDRPLFINQFVIEFLVPDITSFEGGQSHAPSPNAAFAFGLTGLAILFYHREIVISQIVSMLVFSIAVLTITGQAYRVVHAGAGSIYGMTLPTALLFLLLTVGLINSNPGEGLLKYLGKGSPASEILRRFVFAIILVPILLGIATFLGAGKSDQDLLLILTIVSLVILSGFAIVVLRGSSALVKLDQIRSEAENKLGQQERVLAEAQRIAQLGNWELHLDENYFNCSDEVYRLFGLPRSGPKLSYEIFLTLLHPDDRKKVDEAVKKVLGGEGTYSIDYRIVRPKGEILHVHAQAIVILDGANTPVSMVGTIQNITERKIAEESLQQKEQLLSQVIDLLPVGVWIMDKDGKNNTGNEAGRRIWAGAKNVGPESFGVYRGWWEETGKEIIPHEWAAYRAIKFGQTSIGEMIRIQCFDGSTKVILNSAVPLRNKDGVIQGAIIVHEDISERRHALVAAEDSANHLKSLLENADESVITTDPNGNISFANKQVETWFGYTQKELLGQKVELLIPERFRTRHIELRKKYALGPQPRPAGVGLDLFGRRKDGREFPVEISLNPVHSKEGYYVTAIIRDITERKRFEYQQEFLSVVGQELAESIDFETTLNRVVEITVPELADWCLIHVLDSKQRPILRVYRHQDPGQQLLLEKTFSSRVHKETSLIEILRVIRTGNPILVTSISKAKIEEKNLDPDIKIILNQLQLRSYIIAPLKLRGEVLGTITLAHGHSGRNYSIHEKSFAEELAQRVAFALDNAKQYSEAISAVRDREDVLSIVSHDLKNPLNSIQLSTQLLGKKLEGVPENEPLEKLVGTILNASNNMGRLIINILDIGKIQAGTFSIEAKNTSLGSILESVKLMFAPLAQQKELTLKFQAVAMDIEIYCDPDRVMQIFSNLLGNAIKFTPEGGHITVRIEHLDQELRVCVEDDGPGMTEDQLTHVFDRNWQAQGTAAKGSGLGLYISKGIVTAHGGRIWVEKGPDIGLRFYFTLPENRIHLMSDMGDSASYS